MNSCVALSLLLMLPSVTVMLQGLHCSNSLNWYSEKQVTFLNVCLLCTAIDACLYEHATVCTHARDVCQENPPNNFYTCKCAVDGILQDNGICKCKGKSITLSLSLYNHSYHKNNGTLF